MVKKTLLWTAISGLLAAVSAMDVIVGNSVVALNKNAEFDTFINEHDLVLVKFFSPTCSHCINMKHDYEQAATTLSNEQASLVEVDCTINEETCQKYNVTKYPLIQLFRKGRASSLYPYERTTDDIVNYMRR